MRVVIGKIKAALFVFYKSLTSPRYYKELVKTNFLFSAKYYVVLATVFSLTVLAINVDPITKEVNRWVDQTKETIVEAYPEDLTVAIKNGELSTNQPEPIFFPVKEMYLTEGDGSLEDIVVIDSLGTLDDLEDYSTVILLNKTNILVRNAKDQTTVYPLKDYPDYTLTKVVLEDLINSLDPFFNAMPFIVAGIVLINTMFNYFVLRLIYLAVVGVILLGMGKIKGLSLTFSKYFQIAIHTMTLSLTLEVLSDIFKTPINFPFWFLMLNLLMGFIAIMSINGDVERR